MHFYVTLISLECRCITLTSAMDIFHPRRFHLLALDYISAACTQKLGSFAIRRLTVRMGKHRGPTISESHDGCNPNSGFRFHSIHYNLIRREEMHACPSHVWGNKSVRRRTGENKFVAVKWNGGISTEESPSSLILLVFWPIPRKSFVPSSLWDNVRKPTRRLKNSPRQHSVLSHWISVLAA